jgi:hypothetical protein
MTMDFTLTDSQLELRRGRARVRPQRGATDRG